EFLEDQAESNGMKHWPSVFLNQRVEIIGSEKGYTSKTDFATQSITEIVQVSTNGFFFFLSARTTQFTVYKFASSSQPVASIRSYGHAQTVAAAVIHFTKVPSEQRQRSQIRS